MIKSSLVGRIRAWIPGIPIQSESAEPQSGASDEAQLTIAVRPGRALTRTVAMLRGHRQEDALSPGWRLAYRWQLERELPVLPQTSLLLYGERTLASMPRMERFVACPFRHYEANRSAADEREAIHGQPRRRLLGLWHSEATAAVERLLPRVHSHGRRAGR